MVEAKACTAFDLRTECEPMKAILARRPQGMRAAYRQSPVSTAAVEPMNGPRRSTASSAPMA
jgi:hypothetical protein